MIITTWVVGFIYLLIFVSGCCDRRDELWGKQKGGAEQKGFERDQSGSGGGRETLPLRC